VTYFEWTSGIALGHTAIDEQHKRLLLAGEGLAVSLVSSAAHKPSASRLQTLIDLAQEHFSFEEHLMRSMDYPGTDKHASVHTLLLEDLRKHCFRVQSGLHTDSIGLTSFLWQWIVLHIDSEDRDLVIWLKSHEAGAANSAMVSFS
jgi:hemerythrin